ncbi:MAG TPA: hypothetical protein DCZ92_00190 [Elusimicrobia bacterium]|nr:MAG: hypothetical protein A2016_09640 [Elusimicrobia bacterium GWF2_62_30]HBA59245.1 hypothetical protein [Elusimicrobiota bacterium]
MKMIKTVFTAVFAIFTLNTAVYALELNAVTAADIPALTADMPVPVVKAMTDALLDNPGPDPVVITVPGLSFAEIGPDPLEFKYILKLLKLLFPKKNVNEPALDAGIEEMNQEYFMLEDGETLPAGRALRVPDNYIEEKLKELPGYADHKITVIPFRWSRDPDDSETVIPELAAKIAEVYDTYKDSGRPVYILAHSWGTVLSHTALHQLGRSRPDVKIGRWITMGSPLMPGNIVVKMFVKLGIKKEHLEKVVSKPCIAAQWRNIWAERDMMSNEIKAADSNTQVDTQVAELEPQLINLILHSKPLKKLARKDLLTIRSIGAWHGSYFYDYRAFLKSLEKEIYIPVFAPVLAPQVVEFKEPSAK